MIDTGTFQRNSMMACFGAAILLLLTQCQTVSLSISFAPPKPVAPWPALDIYWIEPLAKLREESKTAKVDAERSPSDHPSVFVRQPAASRLVVDLSDRLVYVYRGTSVIARYPIATAQDGWETPVGSFRVRQLQTHPIWRHPITKEMIFPGPENPLGSRWIGFWSDGEYQIGFHGTNQPDSIGLAVSHGCLRMYNRDIEALYSQVRMGTPIIVQH